MTIKSLVDVKKPPIWLEGFDALMKGVFRRINIDVYHCSVTKTLFHTYTSVGVAYRVTWPVSFKKKGKIFGPPSSSLMGDLRLMHFTLFSGNSCKSQLYDVEILKNINFIMQKNCYRNAANDMHTFLKFELVRVCVCRARLALQTCRPAASILPPSSSFKSLQALERPRWRTSAWTTTATPGGTKRNHRWVFNSQGPFF